MATKQREVRLALVLNGGVSLAVWIGGVTQEIDAARTDLDDHEDDGRDTAPLYRKIHEALGQKLIVDVIGGASAGGINGVMLGAAIFNRKRLADLRETWIGLGDFRTLLRPSAPANPPSLMKGDDVVLVKLRQLIKQVYGDSTEQWDGKLYLYVTATDLFGYSRDFEDSTGRQFRERDHRRIFGFQHEGGQKTPDAAKGALRTTVWLGDPDARELLARAARSSSSFPVAFEAHRAQVVDNDGQAHEHWLVDGGILDNQPFNPVLDRIAVLPANRPVKRVVMYVVPYVTEVDWKSEALPPEATARDTYSAAGKLPRDLPKLLGLERVTAESAKQKWAEHTRARVDAHVDPETMASLAETLFPSYQETRRVTAGETFKMWASESFRPGSGVIGQDPADDPATVKATTPTSDELAPSGDTPWVAPDLSWPKRGHNNWRWGLSPAERLASWALLFLADAAWQREDDSQLDEPRRMASQLVWQARAAKELLVTTFRAKLEPSRKAGEELDPFELSREAYDSPEVTAVRKELQTGFRKLDTAIAAANHGYERTDEEYALRVQELLNFEVVQNAFSIDELQIPFPFEFVFASAGIRNSLDHSADTPAQKLAGLKLNHFAGFLKRSWRANDWLWGRLDGVEHVLRAILDPDQIRARRADGAIEALAAVAFGDGAETPVLERAWSATLRNYGLDEPSGGGEAGFKEILEDALNGSGEEADKRFKACRRALAARIQLRILSEELVRVAETARDDLQSGSSQVASGAFWCGRVLSGGELGPDRQVELFKDMHIGEETLADEASSRLVFDVGAQGAAVAAAMFAGDRGGLPAAARAMLGSLRGGTLASSRLIQLLARAPAVGAAVFVVLVGIVVWAATARNTLIGALLPSLALLTVVLGVAVLTLATSVFERSLATLARLVAFAVVIGVPLGFALTFRWPKWSYTAANWLDTHAGKGAVTAAAALGLVAAGLAAIRLVGGLVVWLVEHRRGHPYSRSWRRLVMSTYRWPIVGALATLAGGFVLERTLDRVNAKTSGWVGVAAERRGTILVLVLLATLLLAALLEEVLVPVGVWLRWHVWRPVRHWFVEQIRSA